MDPYLKFGSDAETSDAIMHQECMRRLNTHIVKFSGRGQHIPKQVHTVHHPMDLYVAQDISLCPEPSRERATPG